MCGRMACKSETHHSTYIEALLGVAKDRGQGSMGTLPMMSSYRRVAYFWTTKISILKEVVSDVMLSGSVQRCHILLSTQHIPRHPNLAFGKIRKRVYWAETLRMLCTQYVNSFPIGIHYETRGNWKCLPLSNRVQLFIALLCFRQSASPLISRYSQSEV